MHGHAHTYTHTYIHFNTCLRPERQLCICASICIAHLFTQSMYSFIPFLSPFHLRPSISIFIDVSLRPLSSSHPFIDRQIKSTSDKISEYNYKPMLINTQLNFSTITKQNTKQKQNNIYN